MAIDGDSALENVLNLVQSSIQTGLTEAEKVIKGVLGPGYKPVAGLAQLLTPDVSAIYKPVKEFVENPSPAALTAVGIAAALESPIGKPGKAVNKAARSLRSLPKVDETVTANKAFNITREEKEIWREKNLKLTKEKVAKELRITDPKEIKKINVKDRHRNPELEKITRDFDEGKITQEEFLKLRQCLYYVL
jgi:hypothetical protein